MTAQDTHSAERAALETRISTLTARVKELELTCVRLEGERDALQRVLNRVLPAQPERTERPSSTRVPAVRLAESPVLPEAVVALPAEQQQLFSALMTLTLKRKAVLLAVAAGLRIGDIARLLNADMSTVSVAVGHGLKVLGAANRNQFLLDYVPRLSSIPDELFQAHLGISKQWHQDPSPELMRALAKTSKNISAERKAQREQALAQAQ